MASTRAPAMPLAANSLSAALRIRRWVASASLTAMTKITVDPFANEPLARCTNWMVTTAEQEYSAVYERRWMILGVLCLSLTVIGIDMTIVNVALPSIVRGVDASGSELQWIVDAYAIVFACLLLTAGALGDRFGRRGALLMGLAWFGTFSALASFSHSAWQLILGRGLMGIGGAFI